MKKILITGASGFIGSFLVKKALEKNWEVWAGIRSSSSLKYLQNARISFIDLNYHNKEKLRQQIKYHVTQFGKWDYIIHNAGLTKCLHSRDFDTVNTLYTKHFIEVIQEVDAVPDKFIFMSSLSAYPYPESIYGKSKRKAEQFLESQTGFPYIILRPTGVYGPRDTDYLILLKSLKKGLEVTAGFAAQKLTFIYVRDLVKAVFLALESPVKEKAYFVTDGKVYSDTAYTQIMKAVLGKKHVLKLRIPLWIVKIASVFAEIFAKITGKASTLNRDKYKIIKQRDWTCDTLPIEQELGFHADFDLDLGIRECVKWYTTHGWL
ncbi:MAG: NAD(P)-dependent oxidoreductase [Dysgonamonadaceae bacterium]|jgi:nucleoside-diphosphate-sugar epimerase|nr:NAD(P)-dependent oxidoreductase [Dysgonamonadaceae bacterium]